jgi:hypothetical protein
MVTAKTTPKPKPKLVAASALSEQDIRRILLEHRYLVKADELCSKWQISRATLRAWKKSARFEYLSGDLRELVIAALASGGKATLQDLAAWADYQDHSVYSEPELRVIVDGLVSEGIAAWEGPSTVRYAPSASRLDARFVF